MQKTCTQCSTSFSVEQSDLDFYDKVSPVIGGKKIGIPPPTQCPDCRRRRRLGIRNERNLYRRKCDLSGRDILSVYSPDKKYRVFGIDEWWSDKWDAMSYGRPFDFTRPFFEQFAELQREVPRITFLQYQNENSEYTNYVSHLKNCYMLFSADFDHDCQYGIWIEKSKNCTDNLLIDGCQFCYECIFSRNCYRCAMAIYSSTCSDCSFVFHCKGCTDCFLCCGLRQKKYCILNVQYSKEDYERKLKEFPMTSRKNFEAVYAQFLTLMKKAIHPYRWTEGRVENSTGDLLINVSNCVDCFEALNSKDCRHIQGAFDLKDAMDGCYVGLGELGYENCEGVPMPFHSSFTMNSYTGSGLLYCDLCMNNNEQCFGCVSLRKKKYCILNKQYTKEEYEKLVPRIIEHMRKTPLRSPSGSFLPVRQAGAGQEWGEFFPLSMSCFGYNETIAQEFFPMTQIDAAKQGWKWHTEAEEAAAEPVAAAPDDITGLPADTAQLVAGCKECGSKFKMISQELQFYREMRLPPPSRCFSCRHRRRMGLRNPTKISERPCAKCGKALQSTYAPDRPEIVYCDECYLETVY